jgi:hypothetical protein
LHSYRDTTKEDPPSTNQTRAWMSPRFCLKSCGRENFILLQRTKNLFSVIHQLNSPSPFVKIVQNKHLNAFDTEQELQCGNKIQGGPKVGTQYVAYSILYTYFWPTLYKHSPLTPHRIQHRYVKGSGLGYMCWPET